MTIIFLALVTVIVTGVIWLSNKGLAWWWIASGVAVMLVFILFSFLAYRKVAMERDKVFTKGNKKVSLYLASPENIGEAVLEWVLRAGYWTQRVEEDGVLFKFAIRDDQGRPVTIGMHEKDPAWIQLSTGIGLDPAGTKIFRGLSQAQLAKFKGDVTIEMSRYPMLNLQGEPFHLVIGDRVAVNASLNSQSFLLAIANIRAAFDVGMEVVRRNIDAQATDSPGSTSRMGGSRLD